MSKHRKTSGLKPQGDKKQRSNGRREPKDKTVAAELAAVMREDMAPEPVPAAAQRPAPAPVPRATPAPVPQAASPAIAKELVNQAPPRPVVAKEAVKDKAPASPGPAKKIAADKAPAPPAQLLDTAVDSLERSLKAAGQGTVAVNCKLIDFARANMSSSFDFAIRLASASSPMQIMQLQVSYWDERMKAMVRQAEELRALSADLMAKTNEPLREHMRRRLAPLAG
jgi:hypothetical protein